MGMVPWMAFHSRLVVLAKVHHRKLDLLELLELALGQRARVVEKPADEGGLAVVHVADDDDLELFGGSG